MGKGSFHFLLYYAFTSVIYLVIMAVAFSWIAGVASDCQEKCPMLIRGNLPELDYQACLCQLEPGVITNELGYLPSLPNQTQFDRWQQIYAATVTAGKTCYICHSSKSAVIYQPCSDYFSCTIPGMLGFRRAAPFINDAKPEPVCDTQADRRADASILISPTVSNRAMVNNVLYSIAGFYVIMLVCGGLCAAGYYMFKDKYGSDWAKLSRCEEIMGVLCKAMPIVMRIANLALCILLIIASVIIFQDRTCEFDIDNQGDVIFYGRVNSYLAFVGVLYAVICVFGILFQRLVPRDTSFYAPEQPKDPNDSGCKICCCGAIHVVTTYGP